MNERDQYSDEQGIHDCPVGIDERAREFVVTTPPARRPARQLSRAPRDWSSGNDTSRLAHADTGRTDWQHLIHESGVRERACRHTGVRTRDLVLAAVGHATVAFTLDTYSADIEDLDRDAAGQ